MPHAPRLPSLRSRASLLLRRHLGESSNRHIRRLRLFYRSASTSSVVQTTPEERNENEDTLRRICSILAAASRLQENWDAKRVVDTLADACSALPKKSKIVRLAVYSEEQTPARDLVTALLDDPLCSDSSLRSTIQERRSSQGDSGKTVLRFRQSGSESMDENSIPISSPFFAQFSHAVALEELQPSFLSDALLPALEADIPIIVSSPLRTPSTIWHHTISLNPHAVIVIDGAFDATSPSADRLRSQVVNQYGCSLKQVLLIDTARALRGASTLSTEPSSASVVHAFQGDMLASGVPTLLGALKDIVSLGPARVRADAEGAVTKSALLTIKQVIEDARQELRLVRSRSSLLYEDALEKRERTEVEILGGDAEVIVEGEQGRVTKGVERVAVDLKPILEGLTWYRLPFTVDDVSVRIDRAVERAFAKEFETELIFHTGRLASLQSYCLSQTNYILSLLPRAFNSPVLQNALAQISSSPSFSITPFSPSPSSLPSTHSNSTTPPALLAPLRSRTAQLAHATRALHLSAQRLLLLIFSSTSLSSLSSAVLYTQFAIDAATSVGFGALGTLIGLRWAVGNWERARGKWWGAFERVGDGLERDMVSVLKDVLDKQVCIVPREACEGLHRLANKREQVIEDLEDELEALEAKFRASERNAE